MEEFSKYKYQILEFIDCFNAKGEKDMDIVPQSWVTFDPIKNCCMTAYPNPPYNQQLYDFIHARVKGNLNPMPSWPKWASIIKGGANTYDQAEKRIHRLRNEPYAFTTEDEHGEAKAVKQMELFKKNNLQDILAVSSDNENSSSLTNLSSDSDSSKAENRQQTKKGKRTSKNKKKTVKTKNNKSIKVTNSVKKSKMNAKPIEIKNVQPAKTNDKDQANANSPVDDIYEELLNLDNEKLLNYADKVIDNIDTEVLSEMNSVSTVGSNLSNKATFSIPRGLSNSPASISASHQEVHFSREGTALLTAFTKMVHMLENIQRDVTELKNKVVGEDRQNLSDKLQTYNLKLPLNDVESWYSLDEKLIADADLTKNFIAMAKFSLDKYGNKPVKSLKNILIKILTKSLILQFTAIKPSPQKPLVFKKFKCYSILRDIITNFHTDIKGDYITESVFETALSKTISNAKDWGGRNKNELYNEIED